MLMPKRVKYRRVHRGRMKGKAQRGNTVTYGEFGLQALEPSWITSNQIEAARRAMARSTRRGGKIYIKIFPDKSVTQKPAETRMGSGKGAPEYWVAVVKPGRVLFEIGGVNEAIAREAMRLAARKLPIKTKFVYKEGLEPEQPVDLAELEAQLEEYKDAVADDIAAEEAEAEELAAEEAEEADAEAEEENEEGETSEN